MQFETIKKNSPQQENLPTPQEAEKALLEIDEITVNVYKDIKAGEIKSRKDFAKKYENKLNELLKIAPRLQSDLLNGRIEMMLEELEKE